MVTHSSTRAWKIPWTEEPGRLQSMRSQRVRHDWVTLLTHSPGTGGKMLPFKNVLDLTLKILFNHNSWACLLIVCVKKWEIHISPFCLIPKYYGYLKKKKCPCNCVSTSWTSYFFMEYYFYLKEWLTNYCYSDLGSGRHFLERKQNKPVTSKKTTDSDCCQWKNLSFWANISIWGNFNQPLSIRQLVNCQYKNYSLIRLMAKLMRCLFTMKSVNIWNICITQWSNEQCMHKIVKVQVIPIELNLSIKNSLIWFPILHCN